MNRVVDSVEIEAEASGIIFAEEFAAIERLRDPAVQAVFVRPSRRPEWEERLGAVVESGAFRFERLTLPTARIEELPSILEASLPEEGLAFATRLALIDDIAVMADELRQLAGCNSVLLRVLVEAPTEICGFHIDTVGPGLPPFGLLKVYNGEATRYVLARDMPDMGRFYDYLGKRERLSAEWRAALQKEDAAAADRRRSSMLNLDEMLPFLRKGAKVYRTPPGAVVAFRHLDVRELWNLHPSGRTWLHCSPMSGTPRLVVNLSPANPRTARRR
ncbi:DUF1826 domain-containing protein [Methylocystis sp. H62]|uniref:DUF1826 domain-containing protein n=1 Tax=Methylocystis sp. H62 TaxID=2785789 RepID=UPI0018C251D8|nr:DUF1826 domain-containing protein [Methylocystis sp. H62]MBG0794480.1 DUF1826 domain-containing protein [Methylocystis sp. H62]